MERSGAGAGGRRGHPARFIPAGSGRSLVGSRVFRSGVGFCLLEVCQGLGFLIGGMVLLVGTL